MQLLFVGDIVGRTGRRAFVDGLKRLKREQDIDFVIVNAENAAAGFGVTREIVDELIDAGADVLTSGNHIWDRRETLDFIDDEPLLLRPLNYPAGTPGAGHCRRSLPDGRQITVINVMGQVFMHPTLHCPFAAVDKCIADNDDVDVVFVDFHAEASSEKLAMGWFLDGRAAAVVGTHTHVPTADERVLPGGTAFISDVGMTGCYDSIIGMDIQKSLHRFVHKTPQRLEVATGKASMCAVLIDIDTDTGLSREIKRIRLDD